AALAYPDRAADKPIAGKNRVRLLLVSRNIVFFKRDGKSGIGLGMIIFQFIKKYSKKIRIVAKYVI
ncbi:MAG: hypothetical protein GY893_08890, partial [bacterium]|nr:hypothetical protein [bacterium]